MKQFFMLNLCPTVPTRRLKDSSVLTTRCWKSFLRAEEKSVGALTDQLSVIFSGRTTSCSSAIIVDPPGWSNSADRRSQVWGILGSKSVQKSLIWGSFFPSNFKETRTFASKCFLVFSSVLCIKRQITTNVMSRHFKDTIQFILIQSELIKSNSLNSKLVQFIQSLALPS